MKLDFKNKTYTLRDGSEYRNYCDDAGGKYPVQGAYKSQDGVWVQSAHTLDGKFIVDDDHDKDLIEAKKTHTVTFWVNCYLENSVTAWKSRQDADKFAAPWRISCLEITRTFTEGEGLEGGE